MIRAIVAIAAVTLMLPVTQSWAQQGSGLKSQEDKVSYSIGLSVGRNLKRQGIAVDPDPFLLGVRDAMGGAEPRLSNEEMRAVMHAFQTQMREKQEQDRAAKAKANQDAGRAFLDANKGKKGVVTTTTGLQYRVLTAGTGASPTMQDGHGHGALQGHVAGRHRVRQFLCTGAAGAVPGQRRHSWLVRGAATHEGRREVEGLDSLRACLWCARCR